MDNDYDEGYSTTNDNNTHGGYNSDTNVIINDNKNSNANNDNICTGNNINNDNELKWTYYW